ncbi:MAG: peptidoglycan editing factor PgeF [Woeseiaceae bacterium]
MKTTLDWIPADWSAPANIIAGCTTRSGGVSKGPYASLNLGDHVGDDPAFVRENRRRLVAGASLPAEPLWLHQVHGNAVVTDPPAVSKPQADAIVSRKIGSVCAVMIADCLPILLVSGDGTEVAAIHAGWRGLAGGVVEATLQAMRAAPGDMLAWLGPAISKDHFEVGEEVRMAFTEHDPAAARCFYSNERGRWQADLFALARQRVEAAGIRQVSGGDYCTYGDSGRFYSYRRDGECGRMACFVLRNGEKP